TGDCWAKREVAKNKDKARAARLMCWPPKRLWMRHSWTVYTPNRLACDGGQQKNDGLDGMPLAKRSVRNVVQKRENDGVGGERKRVVAAASNEHGDDGKRSYPGKNGAEHQGANQPGVR